MSAAEWTPEDGPPDVPTFDDVPEATEAAVVRLTPVADNSVAPQNLEAEEHVLGAMLMSPGAILAVSEVLRADGSEFYRATHATIYRASLELHDALEPVDVITLTNKLEQIGAIQDVGGHIRIRELAKLVPASANAAHYARIVKETAELRALIRAGGEISRLGWDRPGETPELIDQAEQIIFALSQGQDSNDRTEHVLVSVKEAFDRLSVRAESGIDMVGVSSGIRDLDALTSGFEPGNLVIIAARPSMGKSALLHTILANVAVRQGLPTCLFTAEMSKHEVTQRLLAREANVDGMRIRKAKFVDGDWARLAQAANTLSNSPFYHDDTGGLRLSYIRSVSRRMKQRHPKLALIAVDFLQIMEGEGQNRNDEIAKLSRGLKILARELAIPIIALSQLNRAVENRVDKRPILSDLRDSGAVEQDADLVMFLYRHEYYDPEDLDSRGIAEVEIAKHRNGPTGRLKLSFQKTSASFSDLAGSYT